MTVEIDLSEVTAEIDLSEVTAELQRLQQRVRDLKPAFKEIGILLSSKAREKTGRGIDAWDNPFAELKATRGRRVGGVPLNDTRQHIYNKITHLATAQQLEVGILENSPIAATHQFGSSKKNIPARPFLPIRESGQVDLPEDWNAAILDVIKAHFQSSSTQ